MTMRKYYILITICLTCLTSIGLNGSDGSITHLSSSVLSNKNTDGTLLKGRRTKVDLNLTKDTAVKIAEIILSGIYGEKVLGQKPWIVTDNGTSFKIQGTFHSTSSKGGVAEITISKSDARVIQYIHGK